MLDTDHTTQPEVISLLKNLLNNQPIQLLRDTDVAAQLGVSRKSVWSYVSEGIIPRPVYLTNKTPRWRLHEINECIAKLPPKAG